MDIYGKYGMIVMVANYHCLKGEGYENKTEENSCAFYGIAAGNWLDDEDWDDWEF